MRLLPRLLLNGLLARPLVGAARAEATLLGVGTFIVGVAFVAVGPRAAGGQGRAGARVTCAGEERIV